MAPGPRRQRRDGACSVDAPLGAQLADGEVLDDAVLHVVEAGVVGVEDARGPRRGRGCRRLRSPHGSSSTVSSHVRIQPCSGSARGALEAADLAVSDGLADCSGTPSSSTLLAVASTASSSLVVLAQLLADGGELLAQQELALRLLHALGDVVADALLERELGQDSFAQPTTCSRRASTSSVSSTSTFCSSDRSGE